MFRFWAEFDIFFLANWRYSYFSRIRSRLLRYNQSPFTDQLTASMQFRTFRQERVIFPGDCEQNSRSRTNCLRSIIKRRTRMTDKDYYTPRRFYSVLIYWIGTLWRSSIDRARKQEQQGVDRFAWRPPFFFARRVSERAIYYRAADVH